MLHAHCSKGTEDESLVDLVSKLLVWKPEERRSADRALQHDCWSSITQKEGKEGIVETGLSQTKRTQFKDLGSKPR